MCSSEKSLIHQYCRHPIAALHQSRGWRFFIFYFFHSAVCKTKHRVQYKKWVTQKHCRGCNTWPTSEEKRTQALILQGSRRGLGYSWSTWSKPGGLHETCRSKFHPNARQGSPEGGPHERGRNASWSHMHCPPTKLLRESLRTKDRRVPRRRYGILSIAYEQYLCTTSQPHTVL